VAARALTRPRGALAGAWRATFYYTSGVEHSATGVLGLAFEAKPLGAVLELPRFGGR